MASYLAFLNNVDVEAHMVKQRTDKHLWEVENYFAKFCKALKWQGISHTIFRTDQLNNRVVSHFHSYILDELKHQNKTYNKMMALMRQFVDWLIHQNGYEISNPFKLVQKRRENSDKTIVTQQEFEHFLNTITPENKYQILPSGERKNRYKDWLSRAYRLALETGLRREEFMCLQFSDIVLDENANPLLIKVENYKVNRIKGGNDVSQEVKHVPITQGLLKLLEELGIDQYRGTDRFLIGHDERASRKTLIEFVSKAFSFYWKRTGIEKNVQLKHLRKTYLTALVEHFGDKAPMISSHSGIQVLKDHYVNDQRLVAASTDFSIF
jgi:integrase